jgi:hypothetical protein
VDRHNGYHKYNPELIRAKVKEYVDDWIEENSLSKEDAESLREHLDEDINYDDGMHEAYRTIDGFSHKIGRTHIGRRIYGRCRFRISLSSRLLSFRIFLSGSGRTIHSITSGAATRWHTLFNSMTR